MTFTFPAMDILLSLALAILTAYRAGTATAAPSRSKHSWQDHGSAYQTK